MPQRFGLEFTEAGGSTASPVMVHRSVLSTAERLMAMLLEQTRGIFPYCLAPHQVWVVPVSEGQNAAAAAGADDLRRADVRAKVVHAGATVGRRIRWAGERHVPVIVIIGLREAEHGTLSVRPRGGEQSDNVPPGVIERALVGAARDRAAMPGF